MTYPFFLEKLEQRQLLAGVTILIPAWNGGETGWLDHAINAISINLGGPQNLPQYVMTVAPNPDGTLAVQGVTHIAGTATPQTSNSGQITVTIAYDSISTNPDYPATETAAVVTNYMETVPVDGVLWASLPMHLISTSRGTAIEDAIAQSFDESGVWVDQETYLDPHPIQEAPFSDPPNTVYDNVEFADDYWRTDGGPNDDSDPTGTDVPGTFSLELTWVQADYAGYEIAHTAPPGYYIGTIEPSLIGTSIGDGPIIASWYGDGSTPDTFPSATQTGFLYTNIMGGARPASGLWAASGGTGVRTAVTHSGTQWPNVADVASTNGTTLQTGNTLDIAYIHEDQSQADDIAFYLDSDQNPFDGAAYKLGTAKGLASSTSIGSATFAASLAGVAPGTYYICARSSDSSGLQRYDYSIQQIVITAPPPAITLETNAHSVPAVVMGTTAHLMELGEDAAGGGDLTYTWTFTHLPAGAAQPVVAKNGTNAAKKANVTFFKQGGYRFTCTITDASGDTITSTGSVTVDQTATKLSVTPAKVKVDKGHTHTFSTTVIDQFGRAIDPPDTIQYAIVSGPGSIGASSGVFSAGDTTGTALIKVEDGSLSDIVDATVVS
jgi:hypothetical protein